MSLERRMYRRQGGGIIVETCSSHANARWFHFGNIEGNSLPAKVLWSGCGVTYVDEWRL